MSFLSASVPSNTTARDLKRLVPNIFLVCYRSKNTNLVVYEAIRDKSGAVTRVDAYWLIMDPDYRAKRLAAGIRHDREELSSMERSMVWGFKFDPSTGAFSFVAHPQEFHLTVDRLGAKLFTTIEKDKCFVQTLYVHAQENLTLANLSKNVRVLYFDGVMTSRKPFKPLRHYIVGTEADLPKRPQILPGYPQG